MGRQRNTKKKSRNTVSKVSLVFMILTIVGIVLWGGLYGVNYVIGEDTATEVDGTKKAETPKKKVINALVCGTNQNLTDTMIYVRYDVETGKIAMMSVPRDTYVTNEYCIGHKLNAIYRGKNIGPLVEEIQELLDVKIDYYLVFQADMLKDMVDALGGVEVDVPINMKYDDPTQNLHINLKKGVQTLNGAQAEHFVRFRHNNDGTGYARGDLQRTEAQQQFIKAFISTVLSPSNIGKIPDLINIGMKNTDTNVTAREALKYVTDASKIDTANMVSLTAPGEAKYIDNLSYFILDEEETQKIIKEQFEGQVTTEGTTTDTTGTTTNTSTSGTKSKTAQ